MNRRLAATLLLGLSLALAATTPARAGATIFSNLGAGDSYNGATGWTLGSPDPNDYFVSASAFTSPGNYELGTIEVAAGLVRGTNSLTISLDADSGGNPGALIESFTISGAMPAFGSVSSGNLVLATSVLNPLLTAGTQYWVVLSVPNDGNTWAAWNWNSIGDTGGFAQSDNGSPLIGGTNTRSAMRITAIPEPASVVLAGTSLVVLLGCGLLRRNKRVMAA
jgi:hypothetical protein